MAFPTIPDGEAMCHFDFGKRPAWGVHGPIMFYGAQGGPWDGPGGRAGPPLNPLKGPWGPMGLDMGPMVPIGAATCLDKIFCF